MSGLTNENDSTAGDNSDVAKSSNNEKSNEDINANIEERYNKVNY